MLNKVVAGYRKNAVSRVLLKDGKGNVKVNKREFNDYFPLEQQRQTILKPFEILGLSDKYDININVNGGGISSQVDASRHAISKALLEIDENFRKELKEAGFLTRDARKKERKKYGLKKARRAPQFSKR